MDGRREERRVDGGKEKGVQVPETKPALCRRLESQRAGAAGSVGLCLREAA